MAYTRDAHAGAGQAMTDLPPMQVFLQTARQQLEQEWAKFHVLRSCHYCSCLNLDY